MKTSWLFESDIFDEGISKLVDEVRNQDMKAIVASYVPYSAGKSYLDLFPKDSCVIFYGSLGFAAQIRKEASWIPGVFRNDEAFRCTSYYPALGEYLLAQEYMMMPYGDLIRNKDMIFRLMGLEETIFIRPDSGSKVFSGQTVEKKTFERDLDTMGMYNISPSELCVISPPRNIVAEWRFVVVDGNVIAGSRYSLNGKKDVGELCTTASYKLAREVAQNYRPDRAWCVDICQTTSKAYYLLEIGCFSCAGLYKCDPYPIVKLVSQAALDEWNEVNLTA